MTWQLPTPNPDDARQAVILHDAAADLLRRSPEFGHTSRRLLTDLVDHVAVREVRDGSHAAQFIPMDHIVLFVVVEGSVIVSPPGPAVAKRGAIPSPAPQALPDHTGPAGGPLPLRELPVGAYVTVSLIRADARWREFIEMEQRVRIEAPASRVARVAYWTLEQMRHLLRACPTLARSFTHSMGRGALTRSLAHVFAPGEGPVRPDTPALPEPDEVDLELVWMAKAPHVEAPIEALTHLLAGAVAVQFDDPTAIVTVGGSPEILVWQGEKFDEAPPPRAPAVTREDILASVVHPGGFKRDRLHRVYFCNPAAPNERTPRYSDASLPFNRVVYLTDGPPSVVPEDLETFLHPKLTTATFEPEDVYFSSFIPSIIVQRPASLGDYLSSVVASCLSWGTSITDFRARRIKDGSETPHHTTPAGSESNLFRDLCRLRLNPTVIDLKWRSWKDTGGIAHPRPFLHEVHPEPEIDIGATAYRWARAVTNARVGVALSGGGACAYRFGPIGKALATKGVPIDVLAGLSGGALIGAYYCAHPDEGLDTVARRGLFFSLTLPWAMVSSWPLEAIVNLDLGGARVEDLETRFVPVTTELPESTPPRAAVVERGTLGEAVRASGTLPPMFGSTVKNGIHYTDGAASTIIPARLLRDYGADLVLAVNCMPGPERTNPYDFFMLGRLLYHCTPVGRYIDGWAWTAFQGQRVSRRYGASADVFVEFSPQRVALMETTQFYDAWGIVAKAGAGEDGAAVEEATDKMAEIYGRHGKPPPLPGPP